jgi:hypothetical protein
MKKTSILSGLLLLGLFGSSCVASMDAGRGDAAQQEIARTQVEISQILDRINSGYLQRLYQLLAQFENAVREARDRRNNALDIAFGNQIAAWSKDYEHWLQELENEPRNHRKVQHWRSYYLAQLRKFRRYVENVREDARIGFGERMVAEVVAGVNGLGQLGDRIGDILARKLRQNLNKILLLGSAVLGLSLYGMINNLVSSENQTRI